MFDPRGERQAVRISTVHPPCLGRIAVRLWYACGVPYLHCETCGTELWQSPCECAQPVNWLAGCGMTPPQSPIRSTWLYESDGSFDDDPYGDAPGFPYEEEPIVCVECEPTETELQDRRRQCQCRHGTWGSGQRCTSGVLVSNSYADMAVPYHLCGPCGDRCTNGTTTCECVCESCCRSNHYPAEGDPFRVWSAETDNSYRSAIRDLRTIRSDRGSAILFLDTPYTRDQCFATANERHRWSINALCRVDDCYGYRYCTACGFIVGCGHDADVKHMLDVMADNCEDGFANSDSEGIEFEFGFAC